MLTIKDVLALLRVSKTTFYEIRKQADFPKARNFGGRVIRYDKGEILEWVRTH